MSSSISGFEGLLDSSGFVGVVSKSHKTFAVIMSDIGILPSFKRSISVGVINISDFMAFINFL
jgi:hypothetical protein